MTVIIEDAVTTSQLIDAVREARGAADAAELAVLRLAAAWADAHPVLDEHGNPCWWKAPSSGKDRDGTLNDGVPEDLDDDEVEWFGIPAVAWDAPATFAAANHSSTVTGRRLIRDALILRHRLPRTWDQVLAGAAPPWRACRVAQAVIGAPADVAAYLDELIAPRLDRLGPVQLASLIDEAMLELHAEEREQQQLDALAARYARLHERTLNADGVVDMTIRADWVDLSDFDRALARVAAVLGRSDSEHHHESLDVRRSIAVGVLADPEQALALLAEPLSTEPATEPATEPRSDEPASAQSAAPSSARAPRKEIVLHLHLAEAAVLGLDPVAHDDHGRPVLVQTIANWCGRTDTHVTVRPVIDLNTCAGSHETGPDHQGAYAVPDRVADAVTARDRTCVFPYCGRNARRCDKDHVLGYADGGPTCLCNLAPLCRHHHNLKTHAGWTYQALTPGIYLWRDPLRQLFLRDHDGTRDLTPSRSSGPPGTISPCPLLPSPASPTCSWSSATCPPASSGTRPPSGCGPSTVAGPTTTTSRSTTGRRSSRSC